MARRQGQVHQQHTASCPARARGRCRCAGSWGFRLRTEGRRVSRGGFTSRQEAEQALAKVLASPGARAATDARASLGFTAFAHQWLEAQAPRLKASTLDHYRRACAVHLAPWFGDVALDRVDRAMVEGLVSGMNASGQWSPKTIANILVVLKAILSGAVAHGVIDRSPAAGVRPPRAVRTEVMIPSLEEVTRALAQVKVPAHRVGLALAARCGLRRGEVLGLRFEDLDLAAGRLRVRRSFGQHGLSDPKSARSVRTVVVPRHLLEELVDLQAAAAEHGEPGFVVPGADGGPTSPVTFDAAWRDAQRRAGVVHHPLHALRHHAISAWIQAGLNVKVVQAMAGHASISTTLDRYGHLFGDDLDQAAVMLDAQSEIATRAQELRVHDPRSSG